MMMYKSIRARLTATFSVVLAALIAVAVYGLIHYSQQAAEHNADSLLMAAAKRVIMETADPKEHFNLMKLIEEETENLQGSGLTISIVDAHGRVIGKSQKDAPSAASAVDNSWRTYSERLSSGNTVTIAIPWNTTSDVLNSHRLTLIWLAVFILVVASAGAWLLVGRALTPISLLARQANASSADDLAISLVPPSQDYEMVELVDTLNGLLRRVTETTSAKGRFYSAASHELRTPLQALSGHLELALSRDRTTEEYKTVVGEAYGQARRLISLVRALLFLYQLDSSTSLPPQESVELVDVCNRSLSHFQPMLEERGLQIHMHTPAKADIIAPPNHIDMLVRNLVENAAKYASAQGKVVLTISVDSSAVRLEIMNDCAALSDGATVKLLEPFARLDPSRNSQTGGTGLGLAICKSLADANGWLLDIQMESGSVRAVLVIPRHVNVV
ncbi:MAG: sensor histidine kinase [Armatimonadota bacterium]